MFEKVNPCHPDKVADRIAGAIVDLAYQREESPRVAVEVLLGHGYAYIIIESSVTFDYDDVDPIVQRITAGTIHTVRLLSIPQDAHLAENQSEGVRCGDNGIFSGAFVSPEEHVLTNIAGRIYTQFPTDGKYIINNIDTARPTYCKLTVCQSNARREDIVEVLKDCSPAVRPYLIMASSPINPLGEWTGGLDVDSGATNRKLGSDMGRAVTGGGLHGKDLSKADVSVNIVCHELAQTLHIGVKACCSIGDSHVRFYNDRDITITTLAFSYVVERARKYIQAIGGFEKFAEWGLIRPE